MKFPKVRPSIEKMQGYTPGEQPADIAQWIKLNTNENPYPPSPKCADILKSIDIEKLRLYPSPAGDSLRQTIANTFGVKPQNVVLGNGSDDILSMTFRVFCEAQEEMAMVTPSYSLYTSLAEIQNVNCRQIPLNDDFGLPDDFVAQIQGCKLLMIPCPNAPTGSIFKHATLEAIADVFQGAVLIDEAYADFAEENAIALLARHPNMIISRTLSKSYALAGLRVGFAIAAPEIIESYMKVKDSYNVGYLPQKIAQAAIEDQAYLKKTCQSIIAERKRATIELEKRGFTIVPSQSNFLFAMPPDGDGKRFYETLKSHKILVRFFPGKVTGRYVRITIGTPAQMDQLLSVVGTSY